MKLPAVVPLALLCGFIGCSLPAAADTGHPSDAGVFLRPDTSCPPANFAIYGPCRTILSRDPVVCGYPLVGYSVLSKSQMKKLAEIGYFVSTRDSTIEGTLCGKPLYDFKEFKLGAMPPCPLPQECG